jgi:hypothetical protein
MVSEESQFGVKEKVMLKALSKQPNERKLLTIGLSFGNLDRFRAEPLDTFIRIDGREMGLEIDVLIFSGETEAAMASLVEGSIGPDTVVHIDGRLKG